MSRKKLIPVIRPSETSRTCSDHGSSPPTGARLVLPERRHAVRLDREETRTPAADPRAQAPRSDVVVGLQPHLVRRHRPRGVLAQERGERLHVVPLERIDVAVEQRALLLVGRSQGLGVLDLEGLEGRARALQGAVHRRDRGVEELGHLGRLPAQDLSEDQHRPLPRRQVLQRGHEREADRLARLEHLGGVAALGHHPIVGHGQDPHGLGERVRQRGVRGSRRREFHRARPALPAAQHVQTDVRHDAVQPRAQRRSPLELLEALPRPQERFLHGVLRLEPGAQHAVGVCGELGPVLLQPQLELVRSRMRGAVARRQLCQPARSSSLEPISTTLRRSPRLELIGVRARYHRSPG